MVVLGPDGERLHLEVGLDVPGERPLHRVVHVAEQGPGEVAPEVGVDPLRELDPGGLGQAPADALERDAQRHHDGRRAVLGVEPRDPALAVLGEAVLDVLAVPHEAGDDLLPHVEQLVAVRHAGQPHLVRVERVAERVDGRLLQLHLHLLPDAGGFGLPEVGDQQLLHGLAERVDLLLLPQDEDLDVLLRVVDRVRVVHTHRRLQPQDLLVQRIDVVAPRDEVVRRLGHLVEQHRLGLVVAPLVAAHAVAVLGALPHHDPVLDPAVLAQPDLLAVLGHRDQPLDAVLPHLLVVVDGALDLGQGHRVPVRERLEDVLEVLLARDGGLAVVGVDVGAVLVLHVHLHVVVDQALGLGRDEAVDALAGERGEVAGHCELHDMQFCCMQSGSNPLNHFDDIVPPHDSWSSAGYPPWDLIQGSVSLVAFTYY